jgi:hypothetical protein
LKLFDGIVDRHGFSRVVCLYYTEYFYLVKWYRVFSCCLAISI